MLAHHRHKHRPRHRQKHSHRRTREHKAIQGAQRWSSNGQESKSDTAAKAPGCHGLSNHSHTHCQQTTHANSHPCARTARTYKKHTPTHTHLDCRSRSRRRRAAAGRRCPPPPAAGRRCPPPPAKGAPVLHLPHGHFRRLSAPPPGVVVAPTQIHPLQLKHCTHA